MNYQFKKKRLIMASLQFLSDRSYGRLPKRHKIYSSMAPATSILSVGSLEEAEYASVKLIRFTDSGEQLLGLTDDMYHVVVYRYTGLEGLANPWALTSGGESFKKLFRRQFLILAPQGRFDPDLLLLSGDGKFAIAVSDEAEVISGGDFKIYCICLEKGVVTDTYSPPIWALFNRDCFHLHGNTIAHLQLKRRHNEIYLVQITSTGKLEHVNTIGDFLSPEDRELVAPFATDDSPAALPGFKHRLLTHMWKQSGITENERITNFYRNVEALNRKVMSKFQFLDSQTLLIYMMYNSLYDDSKISVLDSLFVIYNIETTEIEAVFDNESEVFRNYVIDNIADFIIPTLTPRQAALFSRNNADLLKTYLRQHSEPGRREKATGCEEILPILCQEMPVSPYLDHNFYSWDYQPISPIFLSCDEAPCCKGSRLFMVHCKTTGKVVFRVPRPVQLNSDYYVSDVTLIFHPTDPIFIMPRDSEADYNSDTRVPSYEPYLPYEHGLLFYCPS